MGQVLHGCATTTEAIRRAIQRSEASVRALARRHGISATTVQKWRKRETTGDTRMGPKQISSSVLTVEQEAIIVAFRRHTLLPLDDCLYALQATIPGLTRSSLHRCLQRHGISRLPDPDAAPVHKRFKAYPIGFVHIDVEPEVRRASPRSAPSRASCICSSPSTAPASSRSCSCTTRPRAGSLPTSCAPSPKPCRSRSTPC